MSKKHLILPYIFLTALITNASYLTYKYMNFYYWGGFMSAGCTDDCDAVMTSSYGLLFGIPTPIFGLAGFILLFILFTVHNLKPAKAELTKKLFELVLLAACLGAAVFLYILYFELKMFCKFCTFSHICTYLLAAYYFTFTRASYK